MTDWDTVRAQGVSEVNDEIGARYIHIDDEKGAMIFYKRFSYSGMSNISSQGTVICFWDGRFSLRVVM